MVSKQELSNEQTAIAFPRHKRQFVYNPLPVLHISKQCTLPRNSTTEEILEPQVKKTSKFLSKQRIMPLRQTNTLQKMTIVLDMHKSTQNTQPHTVHNLLPFWCK